MENIIAENYLLLKDQNITPEAYRKNNIFKKLWGDFKTDSLGCFRGIIHFVFIDSSLIQVRVNNLESLGVEIEQSWASPGFNVLGRISIFQLEKISLIDDVTSIQIYHDALFYDNQ
jgi:hypothetical protein